jgi:hypothetical protein
MSFKNEVDFILPPFKVRELHDFRKELLLKKLKMKKLPAFTLGVEEEYQIIDPETRDLRSHLSKIVDGAKVILNEQVKRNAPVCRKLVLISV